MTALAGYDSRNSCALVTEEAPEPPTLSVPMCNLEGLRKAGTDTVTYDAKSIPGLFNNARVVLLHQTY